MRALGMPKSERPEEVRQQEKKCQGSSTRAIGEFTAAKKRKKGVGTKDQQHCRLSLRSRKECPSTIRRDRSMQKAVCLLSLLLLLLLL